MVKCVKCGYEDCEVAYTGEIGYELCCKCWMEEVPTWDMGGCGRCEEREKIHNQQVDLLTFFSQEDYTVEAKTKKDHFLVFADTPGRLNL